MTTDSRPEDTGARTDDGVRFRRVEGRVLSDAELEQLDDVLQAAFGAWPSAIAAPGVPVAEHLRWKVEGPASRPGFVDLADNDGRIVSVITNFPRLY